MSTQITIRIFSEPEIESPEHSERVTGSAPGYAKAVRAMMEKDPHHQTGFGDWSKGRWGWCTAVVEAKATINGKEYKGEATLGNCSYLSAEDFSKSGYLPQMVEEAIGELIQQQEKDLKTGIVVKAPIKKLVKNVIEALDARDKEKV